MSKEVTNVTITDNTGLAREALARATRLSLEAIGTTAERYVKENMTNDVPDAIDTGLLRNSMTYAIAGEEAATKSYKADTGDKSGEYSGTAPATPKNTVYVGTNVEYGIFIEEGTGIHASGGKGRKEPWVYADEKTGKYHITGGSKPHHMIRRAVTEHTGEFREIVKAAFKANE